MMAGPLTAQSSSFISGLEPQHRSSSLISLDEVVPGATVRIAVIGDRQYLSIRDVIMYVCGTNGNRANEIWARVGRDKKDELNPSCSYFKFPGRGQSEQSVISFEGAIHLAMMLPGKEALKFRTIFVDTIQRYLNGDDTMVTEIIHNKKGGMLQSFAQMMHKKPRRNHTEMPPTNYLYASKTDAFPGLIKIGKTMNVNARMSSMNTACKPKPHVVITVAPTFNYTRDELTAHTFFASSRREGEFFEITEDEVKSYFDNYIMAQYQRELAQNILSIQGIHQMGAEDESEGITVALLARL